MMFHKDKGIDNNSLNNDITRCTSIPLMVNLYRRRVLVIGGGSGALLKIKALIKAGARVIVVAPVIVDEVLNLFNEGVIRWWKCEFNRKHLTGVRLVVVVTDNIVTNSDGSFCFYAYTVQEDDCGKYQAVVGNKKIITM